MGAIFYDREPGPVRAVIELAALRDGQHDPRHDLVMDQLFPAHADVIREIATCLHWIEVLGYEDAATALRRYHGQWRGLYADQCADELAAELQGDAVRLAQLVASVRAVAA